MRKLTEFYSEADFQKFVLDNFHPYDRPEDTGRIADLANSILKQWLEETKEENVNPLHDPLYG